jgi:hypothetical protein
MVENTKNWFKRRGVKSAVNWLLKEIDKKYEIFKVTSGSSNSLSRVFSRSVRSDDFEKTKKGKTFR